MSAILKFTAEAEIATTVARCRRGFNSNLLRTAPQRKAALESLLNALHENKSQLCDAVYQDLRKPNFEAMLMEISMAQNEIVEAVHNIDSWMKPEAVKTPLAAKTDTCQIQRDPLGVVLIIGAWNYPYQLTLMGLIGAIAAGNCVVVKPSEVSAHSAVAITKVLQQAFSPEIVGVVNGAVKETTALLNERFDHILYTGNSRVARVVMTAAAKHLTPVTLELGGKSPTVVDDNVDFDIVAQRILWGRCVNAGQVCIAPDYVLVRPASKQKLIDAFRRARQRFLGSDPKKSESYSRMVNSMHYNRVTELMREGKVVVGGECDPADNFIAPTVLDDVKLDSKLMTDEIFGPLIPLINYEDCDDAIKLINSREKPLALYVFSNNRKFVDKILTHTSSGSAVVNDVLMQAGIDTLPFGGVGESGMGAYHGRHTFETFSHKKAIMKRKLALEAVNTLRYPPYSEKHLSVLNFLLFRDKITSSARMYCALLCGVIATLTAVLWKGFRGSNAKM